MPLTGTIHLKHQKTHASRADDAPPDGFIDNTVYRYRILPDGTKELIGTMKAYPEGWDNTKFVDHSKKKGEDNMPPAKDWTKLDEKLLKLKEEGKSFKEIGEILDISTSIAHKRYHIINPAPKKDKAKSITKNKNTKPIPKPTKEDEAFDEAFTEAKEKQDRTIKPETAAKPEPVLIEPEPAPEIIPEVIVKEDIYNLMPGNFALEDEEPISYIVEIDSHHNIAKEIAYLLDHKRADYGTENIRKFGPKGVLVRVSDKIERLINLTWEQEKDPNFESIEDTWKDIAGYAILALIELREGR